jgi:hypothetical protein
LPAIKERTMDDQAHAVPDEPPADENDQRPAIPANADLYPRFVELARSSIGFT